MWASVSSCVIVFMVVGLQSWYRLHRTSEKTTRIMKLIYVEMELELFLFDDISVSSYYRSYLPQVYAESYHGRFTFSANPKFWKGQVTLNNYTLFSDIVQPA